MGIWVRFEPVPPVHEARIRHLPHLTTEVFISGDMKNQARPRTWRLSTMRKAAGSY